ncbi:hypothetical protein C4D60_Mb09t26750 [Musa balbisiana]|uniref:RIN4 pathogenic type III effector avirulence factor Avr cleavage site domain-containing protein n=1 Tax=Musa balbisiana TaxID=52838 RepID=A0A4S8IJE0_MUSBA|nr:hypothetical protein C4D60_Mb09t26750 [Musa balbisiana]
MAVVWTALAMSVVKGGPLPKFGEWDVNNSASAEGFIVIFNKARDEKKTKRTSLHYFSRFR